MWHILPLPVLHEVRKWPCRSHRSGLLCVMREWDSADVECDANAGMETDRWPRIQHQTDVNKGALAHSCFLSLYAFSYEANGEARDFLPFEG